MRESEYEYESLLGCMRQPMLQQMDRMGIGFTAAQLRVWLQRRGAGATLLLLGALSAKHPVRHCRENR